VPASATAQRFLDAWRRNLTTSWSVDESLDRTTAAGAHAVFAIHEAQRPPDRITVGLGSINARQGDQLVACAPGSSGKLECTPQGTAPAYDQQVDQTVLALHAYVLGPQALYAVVQLAGCFQLTLRLPGYPSPPYGTSAVFCFDPVTGAPAGSVIVRAEGTDRTRIVSAHAPATDADLVIPASVGSAGG
jgi:hypothetical protein